MVRHIILWQFNDEVRASGKSDEVLKIIDKSAARMIGKINGLVSVEIGRNEAESPYDFVFCADFTSQEAMEAYQTHPLHEAHKALCQPYLKGRLVADYIR